MTLAHSLYTIVPNYWMLGEFDRHMQKADDLCLGGLGGRSDRFCQQPFSDASKGTRCQSFVVGWLKSHSLKFVHIIMRLSPFHPISLLARVGAVPGCDHFLVIPLQGCRRWLVVKLLIG